MMMSVFKSSGYVFLFCLFFFFSAKRVTSRSSLGYLYHACGANTTTYSPNSTYWANLNQLFHNLSSTNDTQNNGFYKSSVGRGPPDTVYGLYLCRGDMTSDICQQCVKNAATEISQRCPGKKRGIIWYDECMLRYSNQSIVYRRLVDFWVPMYNEKNITKQQSNSFERMLADTMIGIATDASSNLTGKKFATKEVNFTGFQTLYTLVQCTPDLSIGDCNACLLTSISLLPSCCNNSQGATILSLSCNIRYELYPFYNSTSAPAPNALPFQPPPPSDSSINEGNGGISTKVIIAIVVPVVVSLVLFFIGICLFIRRKKDYDGVNEEHEENEISIVESLQYDLNTIQFATNNFSLDNRIGEDGFGAIYKGTFPNGQEIAVKRLFKISGQGSKEFRNEVILVAKLQHRNLVRLLGFCLEGEEKILVYEFIPNKSLDYFLFDPEKRQMLDWSKRYNIIRGIARGMVYLHEDSRLRIIHRDLKASNILLDGDMNPKISDFGMAKIIGVDQSQGNTSRIVGTYGYMSPEYAMHGLFSVKSDVYSFGVLVLEIISGRRNSSFDQSDGDEVLISYAWKLWRDGRPLDLIDPTLKDSCDKNEVIQCMQIGLLCVQEDVDERPNMTSIILTLKNYSTTLAAPRQPAFFLGTDTQSIPIGPDSEKLTSTSATFSTNEASMSDLYPR